MGLIRRIETKSRTTVMALGRKLKSRAALMELDKKRFRREFFKKAVLSYPPRSVTIAISSACSNRCVFCAYHSDDARDGASNVYDLKYRISLEDFKRMIDMCYEGRVPKVHTCATGEPFFHPDIIQMIDYSIEVYGFVSLQTNFFRPLFEKRSYLDEIIQRADSISYITTDILSGDPQVHEALKKGSSYEDVLSSMEYINKHSDIHFEVHYIITKHNHEHIDSLINDLSSRKINCHVAIVNLHPHYFNDFTSVDSLYTSKDMEITATLQRAKELGKQRGIRVSTPLPADSGKSICGSFWSRFQIWPVKGIDEERYGENVIVGGCNAVVRGNLKSLGYIFDYNNIMDLWNNDKFVKIRKGLLAGVYPDKECRFCQNYKGE
jgi:MoaA/NifB/PqqE/SkfB family radical SAM enzyme